MSAEDRAHGDRDIADLAGLEPGLRVLDLPAARGESALLRDLRVPAVIAVNRCDDPAQAHRVARTLGARGDGLGSTPPDEGFHTVVRLASTRATAETPAMRIVVVMDPVETVQVDGMCDEVVYPAPVTDELTGGFAATVDCNGGGHGAEIT